MNSFLVSPFPKFYTPITSLVPLADITPYPPPPKPNSDNHLIITWGRGDRGDWTSPFLPYLLLRFPFLFLPFPTSLSHFSCKIWRNLTRFFQFLPVPATLGIPPSLLACFPAPFLPGLRPPVPLWDTTLSRLQELLKGMGKGGRGEMKRPFLAWRVGRGWGSKGGTSLS